MAKLIYGGKSGNSGIGDKSHCIMARLAGPDCGTGTGPDWTNL